MYYLVKPCGQTVPVIVTEKDNTSLKIINIHGDSRWIKYTDFALKDNLLIMK